jgi:hypothetical protein
MYLMARTEFRRELELLSGLVTHGSVAVPGHVLLDPFLPETQMTELL